MFSSCLMGQTGPLRAYAGFGTMAAAVAGFYPITGWEDRAPAGPFTAYTDYISPRLSLVSMLAALEHRRRTGEGQHIDFSQLEAALHLLTPALLDDQVNGVIAGRNGNVDRFIAPHDVFPAARHRPVDGDRRRDRRAVGSAGHAGWPQGPGEARRGRPAGAAGRDRHGDQLRGPPPRTRCASRTRCRRRGARPRRRRLGGLRGRPPAGAPRPVRPGPAPEPRASWVERMRLRAVPHARPRWRGRVRRSASTSNTSSTAFSATTRSHRRTDHRWSTGVSLNLKKPPGWPAPRRPRWNRTWRSPTPTTICGNSRPTPTWSTNYTPTPAPAIDVTRTVFVECTSGVLRGRARVVAPGRARPISSPPRPRRPPPLVGPRSPASSRSPT